MEDDTSRDFRRLAEKAGIVFQTQADEEDWPLAHRHHFANIQKISNYKFKSHFTTVDIQSGEKPWKEDVKVRTRAKWIAKRAARLFDQGRNEAGWRFGLENDILMRFSVEVACPTCRARLWRSEIEAAINQDDAFEAQLQARRHKRKACDCPPSDRPHDYHEIGTNPLFDDRAQEIIYHDPYLRRYLPKQQPDRVYGLQPTRNFEQILSQPVWDASEGQNISVGDKVRSSPFKQGASPLLFPFLILEAKSESSSAGFRDIRNQTAFPICALLKLQEELQSQATIRESRLSPLVWFFASRGDSWKLYGCYTLKEQTSKYVIIQLWDGSVLSRKGSLQLLLIVDYIFDWARDIYRPSILRLLKSVATGNAYDQVSLAHDSDIVSMQGTVSALSARVLQWVPSDPEVIVIDDDEDDAHSTTSRVNKTLTHDDFLPMKLSDTGYGGLRSASLVKNRLRGVLLTEDNIFDLMQQADGAQDSHDLSRSISQRILGVFTGQADLIVISRDALDALESAWVGGRSGSRRSSKPVSEPQYLFASEFTTYMDQTYAETPWTIIRQLSYVAISETAFHTLSRYTLQKDESMLASWFGKGRVCRDDYLLQAIECLQSGSVDQVFMTALKCTALSFYSLPLRPPRASTTNIDQGPAHQVECLALRPLHRPRLSIILGEIHGLGRQKFDSVWPRDGSVPTSESTKPPSRLPVRANQPSVERRAGKTKQEAPNEPFVRSYDQQFYIESNAVHRVQSCKRCRQYYDCGGTDLHHMDAIDGDAFSERGVALVAAFGVDGARWPHSRTYGVCLFASPKLRLEITKSIDVSTIVTDLHQQGMVHHTIRHPVSASSSILPKDHLWNLPNTYRPFTVLQGKDILAWLSELGGSTSAQSLQDTTATQGKPRDITREEEWSCAQLLLHFLRAGYPYSAAEKKAKESMTGNGKDPRHISERAAIYARVDIGPSQRVESTSRKRPHGNSEGKRPSETTSARKGSHVPTKGANRSDMTRRR